jgi:cell division septum initiation protein DivIVA
MPVRRRKVEAFSMSFLDVICCGFGAVILFYTIISAQSGLERIRKTEDLTAEVNRLEEEVRDGTKNLVLLRNTLERTESETVSARSRAQRIIEELQQERPDGASSEADTLARRERIEKLKADVKALEESTRRLEASAQQATPRGDQAGAPIARADRRYITGLNLKGRRVLVLVDQSASMLSDDLVEVIRLRNSPEPRRRVAPKWRRTVDVVNWVAGQLPKTALYQVYGFNTTAVPLLPGSDGKWLDAGDAAQMDQLLRALDQAVPQDGTSLLNALRTARALSPQPDQIILVTDGMPTQGATPPALRRFVDAGDRARLFDEAARSMGRDIPVDVVLLPMRGDLPASHRLWMFARDTGGAFLMPSKDWP